MLFDRIALGSEILADLIVVVIEKIIRAGEEFVMMAHLMDEGLAKDLAVFIERFVRKHADDTAVVDLDRPAQVVLNIDAEYVQIVILRLRIGHARRPQDDAAVKLTVQFVGGLSAISSRISPHSS